MAEDHQQISQRANELWQRAGQPWGQADHFWKRAVSEIATEGQTEPTLRERLKGYDYDAYKGLQLRQAKVSYDLYQLEQRLGLDKPSGLPPVLWYYTNGNTLMNILKTGEIWATQVQCLNDSQEIRHGMSMLKDVISLLARLWPFSDGG